jgi:ferredoxin--NADP+ reductase
MSLPPSPATDEVEPFVATLTSNERLTLPGSPEDVRRLRFAVDDLDFIGRIGQCVRIMAPGRFGKPWHERLYSIADMTDGGGFELLVRRCYAIDDFNGERYDGVASNYLCNLAVGGEIKFTGSHGHPFAIPNDKGAGLLMIGMGTGVAPFRGLVRRIYEEIGGWEGPVRLFYGARSGLEMLYLNDEKADIGLYYDQPTFLAFKAVSARPHFDDAPALDRALWERIDEVWAMLSEPRTQVYVAGPETLLPLIETPLAHAAGSVDRWNDKRAQLADEGRWHEVLY